MKTSENIRMNTSRVRIGKPSLVAALLLGLSDVAGAHIRMDEPIARNVWAASEFNDPIKQGPCGSGANDPRTTDPNKINTFAPGETITVAWHETVPHESHYRISIDMDGQDDFVDPTSATDIVDPPVLPVLLDGIEDPSGKKDTFSLQVTLPNQTCDHCTLQLIQYMYDDDTSYYICADLVIAGDPVGGDGDGDTAAGGTPGGDGDTGIIDTGSGGTLVSNSGGSFASGGQLASGGTTDPSGQPSSGGATSTGGAAGLDEPKATDPSDDGANADPQACSMRHVGDSTGSAWMFLVPLIGGVAFTRRRRRVAL